MAGGVWGSTEILVGVPQQAQSWEVLICSITPMNTMPNTPNSNWLQGEVERKRIRSPEPLQRPLWQAESPHISHLSVLLPGVIDRRAVLTKIHRVLQKQMASADQRHPYTRAYFLTVHSS